MKYSEYLAKALSILGFDRCFFVAGGNIMHLLESVNNEIECVPVIHEVAACIAAEYYNETSTQGKKAFALVTAGPGITNAISGIAGAYLESRSLLVIGGQVKTSDLASDGIRQRGIQEINGVGICEPITKKSVRMLKPWRFDEVFETVSIADSGRPGPVFLEIPLDVQGDETSFSLPDSRSSVDAAVCNARDHLSENDLAIVSGLINSCSKLSILLGGGVSRMVAEEVRPILANLDVPVFTTWNGADRLSADAHSYCGRPNTWGQRSSNIAIQQSDLLLVFGSRLGLQQTGFNHQEFLAHGKIIQIDIDPTELTKGHPRIDLAISCDAGDALRKILQIESLSRFKRWFDHCKHIRSLVPLIEESANKNHEGFRSPHQIVKALSDLCVRQDIVVPCSSGGAFTTMMQVFEQKQGQIVVSNKGLASMGYGLSGAVGAAFANPERRVILVEGDGGFAQQIQEIGTAAINRLNIKIFIFDDNGYASIRMTQSNYFNGNYVGCDESTGLGLPNWRSLFEAWGIKLVCLDSDNFYETEGFLREFNSNGVSVFLVPISPDQTYFPKISSRVTENGQMQSNPIHKMTPELESDTAKNLEFSN